MTTPAEKLVRLGFGFIVSQALRVVADLEIADRLTAGPQSVADLAEQTGTHADALYRLLRLLAAEGVFRETSDRCFSQTELSSFLRTDQRSSQRDLIRMMNREPYLAFAQLDHSVRTSLAAFDETFGKSRFDWLADHPVEAALFQSAMIALSQGSNEAIAEAYDFTPFSQVVDVGGGHGQLLSAILTRNPHISGVLYDLPSGVAAARAGAGGLLPRAEFLTGSFFESVPAHSDVYVLKKVVHDWNDEQAIVILRNCRDAMKPTGRILVAETIVPSGNEPDLIKLVDADMLVVTGGVERTVDQYAALFDAAGLRFERIIPTGLQISILEALRVEDGSIRPY